jgi:chromate reductase
MRQPRILCFAGSTRSGSVNARLAAVVVKELALTDVAVTQLSLADYPMPLYDGDAEAATGVPANAERLHRIFCEHEGIFVASPEYNGGMTPLLKNTIDWISRVRAPISPWKGRVYAIGAASNGGFGGYRGLIQLRHTLGLALGATILTEMLVVPRVNDAYNDAGGFKDEALVRQMTTMVARLKDEASRWVR